VSSVGVAPPSCALPALFGVENIIERERDRGTKWHNHIHFGMIRKSRIATTELTKLQSIYLPIGKQTGKCIALRCVWLVAASRLEEKGFKGACTQEEHHGEDCFTPASYIICCGRGKGLSMPRP